MRADRPAIAITGAGGFIGLNLAVRLSELGFATHRISRDTLAATAHDALAASDVVFHLAGVNRPDDPAAFMRDNRDYARWVVNAVRHGGRRPLVIVSSSVKAGEDTAYGRSKAAGEEVLLSFGDDATVAVWRLPNVFGKWARPNYNSAVATFCHNAARGMPIRIDDPSAPLSLLHIDDLVDEWIAALDNSPPASGLVAPSRVHDTTVGEVAALIRSFAQGRASLRVGNVGTGFDHALYATYISHLPEAAFSYPLPQHTDPRGAFVEMLKTPTSGQFSYFTTNPGVTRGGHYHHAKVEKFLIVHGRARFRFRHIVTGAAHEIVTDANTPTVVETIPGWTHDVTNIGKEAMVALVWANEIFDHDRPDTVACPL